MLAIDKAAEAGFLSTPSARRATGLGGQIVVDALFLSTPSARRATWATRLPRAAWRYFYPRPPRGGRQLSSDWIKEGTEFLSTPSARRATRLPCSGSSWSWNFYPRPPRGGRRLRRIRPLHTFSDFYPRPPRGGRPLLLSKGLPRTVHFYPRPPRGGRLCPFGVKLTRAESFLSTPSARRATSGNYASLHWSGYFYPRPPRGGRLAVIHFYHSNQNYFYPRPPRGGRQRPYGQAQHPQGISIHALREEGDPESLELVVVEEISIHALREEGDGVWRLRMGPGQNFYPRPPRGGRPVLVGQP